MHPKVRLYLMTSLLIAAVLALLSLTGCGSKTSASQRQQAIPVQTAPAQEGDVSSVNSLTGVVTASVQTDVGTKVSGIVQSVFVNMGDRVSAGQTLAQLDTVDLEKQLVQLQAQIKIDQAQIPNAQAAYDQDITNYKNNQALYASGDLSETALNNSQLAEDAALSQLQVDQNTLAKDQATEAMTQQQISEMTIVSPVDGVVAVQDIEVGEEATTSTPLFTIAQTNPLQVTVDVSEQIIADLKQGAAAQVIVPAVGTTNFAGTVTKISPVMEEGSATYPVDIQIANPDQRLQPGMTASVQFSGLSTQQGVIIPVQSIEETPQGSEVFTVDNDVAHLHLVQIGVTSSQQAVVTSGLQAGEQVVITGQDLLSDGVRVAVVQSASQAGVQGLINNLKQGASGARRGASQ